MRPFDHVLLCGVEFMLWYKNDEKLDEEDTEWYALDIYKNKVCISQRNMTVMPSQCTYYGEWVTDTKFFGELLVNGNWQQFEIKNTKMHNDVQNGSTYGEFTENDIHWQWDIQKLTLYKNEEKWLLRIMTPGGFWL